MKNTDVGYHPIEDTPICHFEQPLREACIKNGHQEFEKLVIQDQLTPKRNVRRNRVRA